QQLQENILTSVCVTKPIVIAKNFEIEIFATWYISLTCKNLPKTIQVASHDKRTSTYYLKLIVLLSTVTKSIFFLGRYAMNIKIKLEWRI
ncbi:unnamed protein product, partial [Larinioides sclopetarius]